MTVDAPAGAVAPGKPEGEPVLSVKDLSVRYRLGRSAVHAVNEATIMVGSGEILGIIGETGSGKSTIVRSLLRLLPPNASVSAGEAVFTSGAVQTDLVNCDRRQHRRLLGPQIGFVPQDTAGALSPVRTVWHHFRDTFAAHGQAANRSQGRGAAEQLLSELNFPDPARVLDQYPHELSGGMAQRVVIALAISLNPVLLIADEPTSGLDATSKIRTLQTLTSLSANHGCAVVIVTHDIGVVRAFCDKAAVMYGGFVVESGSSEPLLERPLHPYTRALLASVPRRGRPLKPLRGRVGTLLELPAGCPFIDRCPEARDQRCAESRPPLTEREPGRYAATFCD
jgi:oligopeptide/dipeptide ABC transporter ATP-binding protein